MNKQLRIIVILLIVIFFRFLAHSQDYITVKAEGSWGI